ncbi:VWA domain-containing protein [Wukongibacter sp. M2B1]|uniref:VWA domain-containing protein n=1 Tax=Wukongibacter sp. M2B1 TaxID=3088895 RepID=UPI003D79695C
MGISFQNPIYLALIPIAIAFLFYFSRSRLSKLPRRKAILGTRTILFLLIILGLSGISLKTNVDTTTTIFAVDLSESVANNRDEFKTFIDEALEFAKKNDRVGVVAFGEKGEVEQPITTELTNIKFETKIDKGFTNIEKALKISSALIPEDSKKRIVLFTDGKENVGDSKREGNILSINDVELKVYKKESSIQDEVQLKGIDIPKVLYENQSFDVILDIYSNIATQTKITLFSGNNVVGEKDVKLEKGNNRFVFKDKAQGSGFKSYSAVITPDKDTYTQNNSYSAFTDVKGKPYVLLIDGESNGGRELYKILESASVGVDYINAKEVPTELASILKYKSIIMSDVSLHNMDKRFLDSLQIYVRDYGGGLVVTGGENSYALGGYYKTKLEEILPVNMEMKIKGEVPSLGLMLVIDKSGSMESGEVGTSKIEIAKEAAIKAVNSLKPKDQIGVVTFDDTPQWVVKPSSDQKEDELIGSIGSIRAGGGTSIIPALNEAYESLSKLDTKLKHIILLTDGQAERSGYEQILNNMKEKGITISTVAVGEGADTRLLESIANTGKGRYYFVNEYSTIPEIFTKETFLASKTYINNRTFVPKLSSISDIIYPILENPVALNGYISTSSKDRAEVIQNSDTDEPILAIWQYGLGKSIAWTPDANGKWTSNYLATEQGIEFFNRMVLAAFYKGSSDDLFVEVNTEGNTAKINVKDLKDTDRAYNTKASIIMPNLEKVDIDLTTKNIGEYGGEIEALEKGTYIIKVFQYEDDKLIKSTQQAITINYSKEYDITINSEGLSELVRKSKGEFINSPEEVFTKNERDVHGYRDITDILIIISLILFVIDIALRRLNIRLKGLDRAKKKAVQIAKNIKDKPVVKEIRSESSMDERKLFRDKEMTESEKEKVKESKKTKKLENEKANSLNTNRLLNAKNKRKR